MARTKLVERTIALAIVALTCRQFVQYLGIECVNECSIQNFLRDIGRISIYKEEHANGDVRFAWPALFRHKISSDRVCFIIMAYSMRSSLHYAQRRSFLRQFKHVYAFADEPDGIFIKTLESIRGKDTYRDAQHRQLRGSQWLVRAHPNITSQCSFFAFIDDDTWLNVEYFLRILYEVEKIQVEGNFSRLALGFAYDMSQLNGGGAIVVSADLFKVMVPLFYTPDCPFEKANDVTITNCAKSLNATVFHSNLFSFYSRTEHLRASVFGDRISLHPVKDPEDMLHFSSEIQRVLRETRAV